MARRKRRFEHDNHDRWLVSYADFVTLLFAFFVVMYSISSVNQKKYKTFSDSLSIAFSNQPNASLTTIVPSDQDQLLKALVDKRTAREVEQQRRMQERMNNLAGGLKRVLLPLIKQHQVDISTTKRGVVIDIGQVHCLKQARQTFSRVHLGCCAKLQQS